MRTLLALVLLAGLSACDNPDGSANALYVAASNAATQATTTTDPLAKYNLLKAASENVQRITTDYPATPAALRIAANENIGPFTPAALRDALTQASATPQVCAANLTRDCFLAAIEKAIAAVTTQTNPENATFADAVLGWPYLQAWAPDRLPNGGDNNLLLRIKNAVGRYGAPPYLINLYETQGYTAADSALRAMAADDAIRVGLANGFTYDLLDVFAARRPPAAHTDVTRFAKTLYGNVPKDEQAAIDKKLCGLTTKPSTNAPIVADCPAETVVANAISLTSLDADQAEHVYAQLPPAKKLAFAKQVAFAPWSRQDIQVTWLERAQRQSDTQALANACITAISEGTAPHPRLLQLLKAAPAPPASTPLSKAGLTPKNLCLIHAGDQLPAQMPAILQNLRADPTLTDELNDLLSNVTDLVGASPSIDPKPLADALAAITSTWPDDSRQKLIRLYHFTGMLAERNEDPLPSLTVIYGPGFLSKLSYPLLHQLKNHGHADLYDKAMANPGDLANPSSLAAQALYHRLNELRASGDARAFVELLEPLTDEQRIGAIRRVFENDRMPTERDAAFEATLQSYPATMLTLHRNLHVLLDFALTPEEQTRIFIAHPQQVIDRLDNKNDLSWITQGFAKLAPQERLQAVQALAAVQPESWIDAAGYYLLLQSNGQ